jgi:hypothetical protein
VANDSFDFQWLKRKFWLWTLESSGGVEAKGQWYLFYGYRQDSSDGPPSHRAVVAVEEATELPTRMQISALWRTAEIDVQRRKDWIVFSRSQEDLTSEGLKDFSNDCASYLEYLLEEAVRYKTVREKD